MSSDTAKLNARADGYKLGCRSATWFAYIPDKLNPPSRHRHHAEDYREAFIKGFYDEKRRHETQDVRKDKKD